MVSKAPLSNELYFSPIFDARELRGPSRRPSGNPQGKAGRTSLVSLRSGGQSQRYLWPQSTSGHVLSSCTGRTGCASLAADRILDLLEQSSVVVTWWLQAIPQQKRSSVLKSPTPHVRTYGAGSSGGGRPGNERVARFTPVFLAPPNSHALGSYARSKLGQVSAYFLWRSP